MTAKVFISHASEDKDDAVRPIAEALQDRGYEVWYDEFTLEVGDSLWRQIDKGLRSCDFGVVVLSQAFFSKEWPQRELDGLIAMESAGQKVILPVWHRVDRDVVAGYSPILAERLAAKTAEGMETVVMRIERAIARETVARRSGARLAGPFLVKLRIAGSEVCDRLETLFSQQVGINSSSVGAVVVMLYEDGSGIDVDASHVQLKGGAKWFPDADPILLLAKELAPELPVTYVPLGWEIPEASWYSHETLHLREHDVAVLFGRNPSDCESESEWKGYIEALLRCESNYMNDVWWGPTAVGRMLVRSALERREFDMVEQALRSAPRQDSRGPFLLAVAVVEELRTEHCMAAQDLVALLVGNDSPLNSHWKDKLGEKLRA